MKEREREVIARGALARSDLWFSGFVWGPIPSPYMPEDERSIRRNGFGSSLSARVHKGFVS